MHPRLTAMLVLAIAANPGLAGAQSSETRPLEHVTPGFAVSVVDDSGRRVDGRVVDISDDAIRVSVRKTIQQIPMDRVVRIDKADSLKNGALVGLAIGLSWGVFAAASDGNIDGQFLLTATLANGLVWTAFGTGIDAMVDGRRTLYQRSANVQARVSPLVGRGVRGAALSVSW